MPATLDIVQLQAELQALRQQVAQLQQQVQRPQVALASSRPAPFLGQSLVLTGVVTDSAGQPQGGLAVVVATTWGRLRSRDRLMADQGTSLTVTTDPDGHFSLDLLPPTSEDLLAAQQQALELLLTRLDATAATPRQTEADLREMAQLYQWEVNHAYRQALDIYFRDFGEGLLESVNLRDYLTQWDAVEATVTAYVQQPGGTTVTGLGVLMVPFRNWLGPWLEVFLSLSQAQNPLPAVLDALQTTSSLGNLREGVYRQVSDYVGSQSGIVGAYIGRKVVEKTVQSFLLEGLANVEDAGVKADLAPTLNMASGLLTIGGISGLQSVVQTRSDLKAEVGNQVEASGLAVGAISDRVTGIATQVTGLQTSLGTVDGRVGTLTTQVTGLQTSLGTVDGRVGTLQTRFSQFDTRVGGLVTDLGTVQEQVEGFQGRFTQIDTLSTSVVELTNQVEGVQGRFSQVDDQVGSLSTQFGRLQRNVDQLDANTTSRFTQIGSRLGTLEGRVTTVDSQFGAVVGRVDTLETTVTDVDSTLAGFSNSLGKVSDRIATHDQTIATLQARDREFDGQLTTLQTSNRATDSRVTALNTEVVGLRQDTVSFNQSLTLTNTSLDSLQRNVGTLNTQVSGLDTRVTTVSGQVGRLSTSVTTLDTQVGTLNTQVGTFDGRFSTLNTQVGGLQRNLVNLNRVSANRIVGLEDSISRVGNNVLSLRTDLNQ